MDDGKLREVIATIDGEMATALEHAGSNESKVAMHALRASWARMS